MSQKSFGVRQLNILGSGSPVITSPNDLNLNANNVAISTNLSVGGNSNFGGIVTAITFSGSASGLTNIPAGQLLRNHYLQLMVLHFLMSMQQDLVLLF
jgi:hypothetical protein